MKITTVGLDLAKNVFQVHGADARGKAVMCRQLRRAQVAAFFARLEPCVVAMEACASAHYWARKLREMGHEVRLIAPQYVKPFVRRNKNDAADAQAICEAATRPDMPSVPIKTESQQAILSVHRAREHAVKARTAQANQIRAFLAEFGLVMPQGIRHLHTHVPQLLDEAGQALPGEFRVLISELLEHFKRLDALVDSLEEKIVRWHAANPDSRRLAEIPGIGPITASALVASVGDARQFRNARQMAAWLGLVPRQHSSGGKPTLLGISKRGDSYLRKLLVHGARAVLRVAQNKPNVYRWALAVAGRRHTNVAAVALANKNARTVWALLAHDRRFRPDYVPALAAT